MPEADLYIPIKKFLEEQGYDVKGEIGPCDVVAVRGEEGLVVVELKERLSLGLVLQGVDRLAVSDAVYIAFQVGRGRSTAWRARRKQVLGLLRRLGLGLLTVTQDGNVIPLLDPAPYRPRANLRRRKRLLREFTEREGDPETGGSASRQRITVYRQDALRCARMLSDEGTLKVSVLRDRTGVSRAGPILRDNYYGWFDRVRIGYYALTAKGERDLLHWDAVLEQRGQTPSN